MSRAVVALTRVECFSAAHRLNCNELSEEENIALYGKCNTLHGHNYTVEVTVSGPVDPKTGMVVDLNDLKKAIQSVTEEMDHKTLDRDIPHFHHVVSSTENITIYIWDCIKATLPDPSILKEVVVRETSKNFFRYCGQTA